MRQAAPVLLALAGLLVVLAWVGPPPVTSLTAVDPVPAAGDGPSRTGGTAGMKPH